MDQWKKKEVDGELLPSEKGRLVKIKSLFQKKKKILSFYLESLKDKEKVKKDLKEPVFTLFTFFSFPIER